MLFYHVCFIVVFAVSIQSETIFNCDPRASCGCSSQPATLSRIFGGEQALAASWAWAVHIQFNETYICGGTIISPLWVLTSAACVWTMHASEIMVYAGSNILFGSKQKRQASRVIKHPNFDSVWFTDDIALIQVSPPFNMHDPLVRPICLPDATHEDFPSARSPVVTVGWGAATPDGSLQIMLAQAALKRVASNDRSCMNAVNFSRTQLCAIGATPSQGICGNDIGGPLMSFTTSRQWILIGINSYYFGCIFTELPSVHTRVIPYLNWIRSMNVTDTVSVESNDILMVTPTTVTNLNRNNAPRLIRQSFSIGIGFIYGNLFGLILDR